MHGITRWAVVTLALAALATVPATVAPRAPKDQSTAKVVAFHHAMDTL
jgi:hypothetical protein